MEEKLASSSTVSQIGNVRFNEYKLQPIETENMHSSTTVETKENEKPLLLDDISGFLEMMHSKNLTLKKLAKVQNSKLDSLRKENDSIRLDNQRKDQRIKQLEMEVESLRSEVHTLRHELLDDEVNDYLTYDLDFVPNNGHEQSDMDSNKTEISDDQIDCEIMNNEKIIDNCIPEDTKDSSDESLTKIDKENNNMLTGLFKRTKGQDQTQKRNNSLSYLYSWSYLALKQAVFVSLETNTWS